MKILFDQNVPRPLARFLSHHSLTHSAKQGWEALKNGDLLQIAEAHGFDVLVTAERNLSYQQNLKTRKPAIIVLPSGQWPEVMPPAERIAQAVDVAAPGSFVDLYLLRGGKT